MFFKKDFLNQKFLKYMINFTLSYWSVRKYSYTYLYTQFLATLITNQVDAHHFA